MNPSEAESSQQRLGRGLWIGTLAGAAAAAFAATRAGEGVRTFLTLWSCSALLLGLLCAGWLTSQPLTPGARRLLCGFGLAAFPLALLATLLKVATHHRPLGAVTLTLISLIVLLGFVALSARVDFWLARLGGRTALTLRAAAAVAAGVGPCVLLARLLSGAASATRVSLLDLSVGLGTAAALLLLPSPAVLRTRRIAVVALPIWIGAIVVGVALGIPLQDASGVSPVLGAALAWLSS